MGSRYRTYQKILPSTSWPNLPNAEVIYEREPFAASTASESNEVGVLPEEPVQNHLAAFLDSWMQMHESNIYARLEFSHENLDLAVNVFVCASCKDDLIGLKDLRSHFKCIGPQFEFRFSFTGRASALALVDLLDMDPKTATVNLMDARDARFFCEGCNISWNEGVLDYTQSWSENRIDFSCHWSGEHEFPPLRYVLGTSNGRGYGMHQKTWTTLPESRVRRLVL